MGKEFVKGGAGPHNWGSLMDERELEEAALEDAEQREQGQEASGKYRSSSSSVACAHPRHTTAETAEPTTGRKASVSISPEERQKALDFRKNAFKSPSTSRGRSRINIFSADDIPRRRSC